MILLPTFNRVPPCVSARTNKPVSGLKIQNAGDTTEIRLYDEIGFWGVDAKTFIDQLDGVKSNKIDLRINSPGGDVFDAVAIYNALARHPAEITAHIDGLAASAASFLAMSADRVVMGRGSFLMIHNAWGFAAGDAKVMRQLADTLDNVTGSIAGLYAKRADRPVEEIAALMDAETWLNADEAVQAKLADAVAEDAESAAQNKFDLSAFRNTPAALKHTKPKNERELEKALRDGGLSHKDAKAAIAGLKGEVQRDVESSSLKAITALVVDARK